MSPTKQTSKPKPERPWQRAEAGSYRSSDGRFTIQSEGPSRWFFIDEEQRDELGLARTTGPFPTLDAAKAAADEHRERGPESSPLAGRLAGAGSTSKAAADRGGRGEKRGSAAPAKEAEPEPEPKPTQKKTWLDKLEEEDRDAGRAARRLIATLERGGIDGADALVRRDVAGDQPAIAARLLAREILAAVTEATEPEAIDRRAKGLPAKDRAGAGPRLAAMAAVEAVIGVLTSSRRKRGLPGWEIVERDGPTGESRVIRLTDDDLRSAGSGD